MGIVPMRINVGDMANPPLSHEHRLKYEKWWTMLMGVQLVEIKIANAWR